MHQSDAPPCVELVSSGMRVLMVSHTAERCGSNDVVMALLENIPEAVEVHMAFLGNGPLEEAATALGVSTEVVATGRMRDLHRLPRALTRLRSLASDSDAVFSHVAKSQALAGWAARSCGTRSVWFQHELPGVPRVLQGFAAASRPALTIANSEFVATKHRERWPRATVSVVHPGIQAPAAEDCRVHTNEHGATVAVLSRLDRWKRVELSIDAFAKAQAADPSLRLLVIGGESGGEQSGNYMMELRQRAELSTIQGSVEFLGPIPNAKRRFKEIDVLVQLSEGEPFGLSVAESLSYGVPAVVSDDGGIVEIVDHERSGYTVDAKSPAEVAGRILQLTGDAKRRTAFGQAGRQRALTDFNRRTQSLEMWRQLGVE